MSTTSSGGRWPRCWVGWWWRYPTLKEHRLERIRGVLNYQLHFIIYFKLQQGQGPHSAQMKLEQDQRSPVGSSFSVFLNISYIYIYTDKTTAQAIWEVLSKNTSTPMSSSVAQYDSAHGCTLAGNVPCAMFGWHSQNWTGNPKLLDA